MSESRHIKCRPPLVQSRSWLDSPHLCSQAKYTQRSKADQSAGLSCEVNAGEREGDEEINDEQSDDTINRPIGFNKSPGAPHVQRSDKVRAPRSLVPHCTPPGLSPTSVHTRVRFLHCYEDTGLGRARSCSKQTCLCALLRIHVLFTQAIVTLITTRKRLTHLNVLVISLISSMSLMSLIVATVRVHREV